jgi:dihydrofolate reductase
MRISLIVAAAENGTIGRNGDMPWRMSSDLKHFRALTLGKPVVMGRKTFQSIGKPLDGRDTIVVTRDANFNPAGVIVAVSINAALALAQAAAEDRNVDEIMIVGGGEIYRAILPRADRVYLTRIEASPEGDATFPALPPSEWREIDRRPMVQSLKDDFPAEFIVYDRLRR